MERHVLNGGYIFVCNFCCLLSLAKLLLSVLEKNIDLSAWRCRKWYWQEHSYSKLSGLNFMLDHHNLIERTLGLTTVSLSFFLCLSAGGRQCWRWPTLSAQEVPASYLISCIKMLKSTFMSLILMIRCLGFWGKHSYCFFKFSLWYAVSPPGGVFWTVHD